MISERDIQSIADEVVARLAAGPPDRLIDAAELADRLAVDRRYVYANADAFGAIRIGTGEKARLRFDWRETLRRIDQMTAEATPTPPAPPAPARGRRRKYGPALHAAAQAEIGRRP